MDWFLALAILFSLLLLPLIFAGIANTYYGMRYRLPFVPSGRRAIQNMMELGDVREGVTVLDIGSGAGDILLAAARRGARAEGVEINAYLVWFTRFRAWRANLSPLISVTRANMFSVALPRADVVMLYLPSQQTATLQKKIAVEMPPYTLIISNGHGMPGWTPCAKKDGVHAYRLSDVLQNH